jgi:hypothetical protein
LCVLVRFPPGRGKILFKYSTPPPPPLRASIHGYLQYSGRGRGRPANHPPPPQYLLTRHATQLQGDLPTPLTQNNTQQHTTTLQHYTTALGYIKLPMYLLFLWRLYLMVLRAATSLLSFTRALEGVGSENLNFFGPKWHSLCSCHFRAQKSLNFQGPPLPMPLVMMLHASKALHTAP